MAPSRSCWKQPERVAEHLPSPHQPEPAAPDAVGGIDLGGTKIEAIVADAAHRVLGSARPT
jgi:hypothetical protein